jgi:hypothetical protein
MRFKDEYDNWLLRGVIYIILIIAFILFLIMGFFAVATPKYSLWSAQYTKKIQVEEAIGKKMAAIELAQAEIERAKGVAESNKIIAESLDEQYLRYLWIQGLNDGSSEVIYVPTEANLPILEARDK